MTEGGLRDRTRRAVQAELAAAAQELFLDVGFDAATIDDIARRAGMSRRSFFRYFASKEELITQKYALWADDMAAELTNRPTSEPTWVALRRTFDRITDYYADPVRREQVLALQAVVDTSPALSASTLQVFHTMQRRLADILVERTTGSRRSLTQPVAFAVVVTAWAAVQAALARATADDLDRLPAYVDEMMAQLRPSLLPPART